MNLNLIYVAFKLILFVSFVRSISLRQTLKSGRALPPVRGRKREKVDVPLPPLRSLRLLAAVCRASHTAGGALLTETVCGDTIDNTTTLDTSGATTTQSNFICSIVQF